jgi:hypothetical protein
MRRPNRLGIKQWCEDENIARHQIGALGATALGTWYSINAELWWLLWLTYCRRCPKLQR